MDLFLANRPFVSLLQRPQAHGFIVTRVSLSRLQRGQSKKFRISVEKLPGSRRGIGAMSEQDSRWIQMGAIMTIAEYLAATVLTTLIVWVVLGLLMQEN